MDEENERIHDEIIAFLDGLDIPKNKPSTEEKTHKIDRKIQLVSLPAHTYLTNLHTELNNFLTNGQTGIYISFQRPANNLTTLLYNSHIDTTNLSIIDMASELTTQFEKQGHELHESFISEIFTKIQYELTDLTKTITTEQDKFILLDSINTMALYLNQNQIIELITLIQKNLLSDNKTSLYVYGAAELYSNQLCTYIQEYINLIDTPTYAKDQQIISNNW